MSTPASDAVSVRLLGAFSVGLVVTPLAGVVLVVAAFGGLGTAALGLAVIVVGATAALVGVHQATQDRFATRRWGWALGVVCGALALAAVSAGAWQHASYTFGQTPLLWAGGVGTAFLLAAAAGTRRTRWPATLVIAGIVVVAGAELRPDLPEWEQRGCIASSPEQAQRVCA